MDDDWEQLAEKEDVVVPPKIPHVNKWDGEDEEEEVKDSWEDEEEKKDEEKAEAKPTKLKPKKSLQEKINEKEQQRIENELRLEKERNENLTPEEKLAEKLRLQKVQEEEDFKAAMDTFGITETSGGGIDGMNPTTKEEFLELSQAISTKVANYKSSEEFPGFIEELVRNVCANLSTVDLRKIKVVIENLHTEKQKMEKEKSKKAGAKGKTKVKLRMDEENVKSNNIDDYGYDYDYDDFM